MKHLSDFNSRSGFKYDARLKSLARCKRSILFSLLIGDEEKSFVVLTSYVNNLFSLSQMLSQNKLKCWPQYLLVR